jgi:Uma2 family endonuclease
MAEYKAAAPHWRERPFAIVPDFVAEVVSPNDKVVELDDKIDAYLRDGVRLVWVVYPYVHRPKVMVYTPDAEHPARFAGDVVVDAGDVIPDFKIALPKLFE